mmetsp:Transcript_6404/g.12404  ORF Transcript_6404/g.12404 Transcript_6404/m.12404 type:complete len:360 (-) Transcript_6404:175-1254(-)|eukprot:CAMPEP_0173387064 /NCGR_PEP_ID=MMETSP1356-20130122/9612_1 /TAXON_ID=77927 ORGANISM="Hemiselmis virescens, Strain PCC157" /NCGR_SAMPLE_ID=MMETSP1356 /ASSEMBLY_ACC=CAM_ASM_000847 /LENGTH=359 /DNA_ID=CAMNT_0014343539 /DNA_START=57 /DNA_END=1136 /DNA_ORIENTATION=+
MIKTKCLACKDASGKMMDHEINRRAVGPNDVHIKVSYSGICHSDIHTGRGEWGPQTYPLCVGHEILGKVVAVGASVTKFKVGDTAGVGCMVDSCRTCPECKDGDEQFCTGGGMVGTYGSKNAKVTEALYPGGQTQGGYSSDIVVEQDFVIKVPENMHVAAAAPLLCAGITCYEPFVKNGMKAGENLGVVGLGGLGHMAVKIGAAMGMNVTVITRDAKKVEMAKAMGAKDVVISSDKEAMAKAAKSMHYIYNSIAFDHDVQMYMDLLKNQGTMILVGGVPQGAMPAGSFALIGRGLKLSGSLIGGIKQTQDMMDFCAKHNLVCDIELIPATCEAVDKAWERTVASDVKFRFVIDTAATLK